MAGCGHVTIGKASDHETLEEDVELALLSLEDGGQSTFISAQLSDYDENEGTPDAARNIRRSPYFQCHS
ncbi:uncharacterized protein E5676_scaffold588G00250 [Cucumis melo var. makuwa]|uniref:Uncharacterized protein n=1 Tax=Cucumis melo var. makuwa TaxID=1194695 RepID=A0A5D3E304_CUCMM|nr:uncharacterized protein E5676_scaffold588G00250 [Cucumis melo var. makuwa]